MMMMMLADFLTVAHVVNLVRRLHKFMTLTAHLSLQHADRDAERRAVRLRKLSLAYSSRQNSPVSPSL